jgi:eukaryotic-like serine/threonine-protein kinase
MAAQPQFVGQTLGRYRVLEETGVGGMGVVYRAHDQQLERDVAIKVLPGGLLADETARKNFRKEALALAKLNHPSIETIHEFGSENGVDFIVTEYIPGITLDGKLAGGALPEPEILRLAIQLTEGLEAAHEQRIVHRDLKPSNLRLSRSGQLKILDFGLAKFVVPANETEVTSSLGNSQRFTGTVPYMAPEQLLGKPVDSRSDIWAVGAVLYEMATAHRPFEGETPAALIADIIHKDPPPPRSHKPDLPSRLEGVILKCLEKNPERRYQSAHDLRIELERLGLEETSRVRRAAWRWALVLGILGLGVVISSRYLRRRPPSVSPSTPASVHTRRSVAVLGFKNLSGKPDAAWLSTALSEMLTTELAAGDKLRTVPGETVAQMKVSLALPDAESFGKTTLTRIRHNLESDDVVLGSYMPLGGGLVRVDLWLQDTAAGETLATLSEKGSEEQLDELANKLGAELRAKLGVGGLPPGEVAGLRASLPRNANAARFYAEGLARLRISDYLGARELLQKAVAAEPGYALSHSALSAAWLGLGYQERAKEEAKKAVDNAGRLPPEQRLWVEGHYRETTHEFDKAVEIYRRLLAEAPDDIESGLYLAAAQTSAGKANDSLSTIQALRNLPSPMKDDPRIDLTEAVAAESVSDFKRESSLAAHAATTAAAQGARLLVARARLTECSALDYLHELKSAMSACEEARTIYASAGDPRGSATALLNIGNILADQGDLDRSNHVYEESLKISRRLGSQGSAASALNNIATNLTEQGDLAGAMKMYQQALAIKREVGAKDQVARTLYNLGIVLMAKGDFYQAEKMFDESLSISDEIDDKEGMANAELNSAELFRRKADLAEAEKRYDQAQTSYDQISDKDGAAYSLIGLAAVLSAQGDLSNAQKTYEQGLEICRSVDDKHEVAFALIGLGDVLLARDNTEGARKKYEEALSVRKELGEKSNIAETELALATVALEEGRLSDAQAAALTAREEFRRTKLGDDETLADVILGEALLASGNLAAARTQVEAAVSLAAKSQSPESHWEAEIASARVAVASRMETQIVTARNRLETIVTEAARSGFLQEHFEARLVLGQIELASGETAAGRVRLAQLEKDATARGFLLIARKAHSVYSTR